MSKTALITGINGQDGSYLAELLLEKDYHVHGIVRRASQFNTQRIDHIYEDPHKPNPRLFLHFGDLTDGSQVARLIRTVKPDEIYNLAAQSHVAVSFQQPAYTGNVDGVGTVRLLEAIREAEVETRFYQAGTSEMFGSSPPPQSETTEFRPRSPYAAAKLYAHWVTVNCREAYGMFTSNGILFNHESPRRGPTFVTRKTTRAVARIVAGLDDSLFLGNLDAKRDWGHARDYVRAMWMILQQDTPDDYVIGTGESASVRDFVAAAFGHVGLDWQRFVKIDAKYFRPTEVEYLLSDPSKAKAQLGWEPTVSLRELCAEMVEADLALEGITLDGARERVAAFSPEARIET